MHLSPLVLVASSLTALAAPVLVTPQAAPLAITLESPPAKRGWWHDFEEESGLLHDGYGAPGKERRSSGAITVTTPPSKRGG